MKAENGSSDGDDDDGGGGSVGDEAQQADTTAANDAEQRLTCLGRLLYGWDLAGDIVAVGWYRGLHAVDAVMDWVVGFSIIRRMLAFVFVYHLCTALPRHAPSRCLQPLRDTLTCSVAACGCLCMRSTQSLHCCPLFSCRRLQCSHFLLLPSPTNYKSLRQCQASAGMCGGSTTTSAWPTKLIHTFRARNQIWQDAAAPILISWALLWNFRFVLTHVRRNQDGCVAMTCDAYPLAWSGVSL